jgi:hypothetical protein
MLRQMIAATGNGSRRSRVNQRTSSCILHPNHNLTTTSTDMACCEDFRESEPGQCMACKQEAQIMPGFDMCQTCITGEASDPTETFHLHSLDCIYLEDESP